ncbi:hypothetical protein F2Q68_00013252 [Brassica cretica]|uniref:Uncharacterized protein n=1 Tax=Brassica cretica TaxID=69181 RepID=A0A8S9HDW4_BRACR|nr:hypothetical protein F2Q68_00013252 [Brassica cretica]
MQAPKVFWWSLRTGDSVARHVTAEDTRQGFEFDMEEAVRVYLDRLQWMHAPKVSWWSLRSGDSDAGQVTTEETRHGLEFDMEEAVKVYLRRASQVEAEVSMVIIKCMVMTEVIRLHGFEDMVVIGRASGLRFQGKAAKESSGCIEWMKPDELYSEYVRLKRSDLRRLQEMQKIALINHQGGDCYVGDEESVILEA